MKVLVTGSSGHLGEGLVRVLRSEGHQVVGLDLLASPYTDLVGSVCDRQSAREAVDGVDGVIHAATLHKPHMASRDPQAFVETNIAGTSNLLDAAVGAGVGSFVFTSTTSAFGRALTPSDTQPAAWITEDVVPLPRNIYGVTKVAAEDLCQLAHQERALPCVVLRVARFFPEDDDDTATRDGYTSENAKVNELLYRRVDLADAVTACLAAMESAERLGFGRYVISATTPFGREDMWELRADCPAVVRRLFPHYEAVYRERGWKMFPHLDRVYANARARQELRWAPRCDFGWALERLCAGEETRSSLAAQVGAKGYGSGRA